MSIFIKVKASCAACGATMETNLAASVNADRRPDLRQDILDGNFQSVKCTACGMLIRLPAHLTYIDIARGQWILVEDAARLDDWTEAEAEASDLYAQSFGPQAPPIQQKLAAGMSPRLVFGWAALREKLLIQQASLDDLTLELLKISILRNVKGATIGDASELRLTGTPDGQLTFRWINTATEEALAELTFPREIYDDIAQDMPAWSALTGELDGKLFLDLRRLIAAPSPAAMMEAAS